VKTQHTVNPCNRNSASEGCADDLDKNVYGQDDDGHGLRGQTLGGFVRESHADAAFHRHQRNHTTAAEHEAVVGTCHTIIPLNY